MKLGILEGKKIKDVEYSEQEVVFLIEEGEKVLISCKEIYGEYAYFYDFYRLEKLKGKTIKKIEQNFHLISFTTEPFSYHCIATKGVKRINGIELNEKRDQLTLWTTLHNGFNAYPMYSLKENKWILCETEEDELFKKLDLPNRPKLRLKILLNAGEKKDVK